MSKTVKFQLELTNLTKFSHYDSKQEKNLKNLMRNFQKAAKKFNKIQKLITTMVKFFWHTLQKYFSLKKIDLHKIFKTSVTPTRR